MHKMQLINKKLFVLIFTSSILLVLNFPLGNFIASNDSFFHLIRIEELARNIKNGIWLPSLQFDNVSGMGYLVDVFYPNTFFYIPSLLRLSGLNVVYCMLFQLICFNILAISLTYFYGTKSKLFTEKEVFVLIFLYFTNFFIRMTFLLELFVYSFYCAFLFFPLIYIGLYDLYTNKKISCLIIGISLILNIHVISFAIICGFIFVYALYKYKETFTKNIIFCFMKAILLVMLINCYFWLPFLYFYITEDIYLKSTEFSTHFSHLDKSIYFFYVLPCFITSILIYIKCLKKEKKYLFFLILDLGIVLFGLLGNTEKQIELRLSVFSVVLLCFLCAISYKKNSGLIKYIMQVNGVLAILFVILSQFIISPYYSKLTDLENNLKHSSDIMLIKNTDIVLPKDFAIFITGEYFNKDINWDYLRKAEFSEKGYKEVFREEYLYNLESFSNKKLKNGIEFTFEIKDNQDVVIPFCYYKNCKATYNGKPIPLFCKDGFCFVKNISSGVITITYDPNYIQYIAFSISVLSIISMIVYIVFLKQKTRC